MVHYWRWAIQATSNSGGKHCGWRVSENMIDEDALYAAEDILLGGPFHIASPLPGPDLELEAGVR